MTNTGSVTLSRCRVLLAGDLTENGDSENPIN
jgi:hypothetical protein